MMEKLNELVELAKKATSGKWIADSGEGWDAIISQQDMVNGIFIISEFTGPDSKANKDFVLAASPETILAIAEAFRSLEVGQCGGALLERKEHHVAVVGELLKRNAELEQRAEAAEADCARLERESQNLSDQLGACDRERMAGKAKLAELEKQEPTAYAPKGHIARYLHGNNSGCWVYGEPTADDNEPLFSRPVSVINLAELVQVAMRLKRRYICNEGGDLEFIACVTPEKSSIGTGGTWDDWRELSAILRNIEEAK